MLRFRLSILLILFSFSGASWGRGLTLKLPNKIWEKITHFENQANYQLRSDTNVQVSLMWNLAKTKDLRLLRPLYTGKMVNVIIKNKKKTAKEDGYSNWKVKKKLHGKLSFSVIGTYKDKERNTNYFIEKHFHFAQNSIRFIINSKKKTNNEDLEKYARQVTKSFRK